MKHSIIVDTQEINKAKRNQKLIFTHYILSLMDLKVDDCFPLSMDQEDFTIQHKMSLRDTVIKANVNIVDYQDDSQEILVGGDIVAKWNPPMVQYTQKDGKLVAVLNIDFYSVFEDIDGK